MPKKPTNVDQPITGLLRRISAGDRLAANELFDLLYSELRAMAASAMRGERDDHTLQTTALVHETFARLIQGSTLLDLKDRAAFYSVAAKSMRSILVDHARRRNASKRPPEQQRVPLDDVVDELEQIENIDLLAVDEALEKLERLDERQYQIVNLHFFGGLRFNEIAEHLGVSLSTVEKDWKFARCWLLEQLDEDA